MSLFWDIDSSSQKVISDEILNPQYCLLLNYLILSLIYTFINEQLLWLIIIIYSEITCFGTLTAQVRKCQSSHFSIHNGRLTWVELAKFSGPDLHQIWSDWHRIFFVHIANFLLYLNKIWKLIQKYRKTLKNDIYRRESAKPDVCVITIATSAVLCCWRESISYYGLFLDLSANIFW